MTWRKTRLDPTTTSVCLSAYLTKDIGNPALSGKSIFESKRPPSYTVRATDSEREPNQTVPKRKTGERAWVKEVDIYVLDYSSRGVGEGRVL